ncbi:hypothetical protein GCM10025867_01960 [Frondihabitans sucicola]|uniref:DUF308 domain-containing protein n=1 Tax=Frondihabitans sucicola TaxID=1268041 RepID=A0ABN6XWC5_9MICO|nr:DUF308 domain-containing protein [Frondihabitans sucicola]BDZ47955.1 hypothetical protein GCM10025867_01960 [Frondihabitans sucicola]
MTGSVQPDPSRFTLHRSWVLGVAIAAIVLGLIALFFPAASLLTIAIVFGIFLLVLGLFRLWLSFSARDLATGARWLTGILGALILVAAILCLADPFQSLQVLGFVSGFGWIFEGAAGVLGGWRGFVGGPRWLPVIAGVVSIVAGIVMMILPVAALSAFVTVGGIILIVLGVVALLHLPRR